jgi:hypothetical protein
MGATTYMVNGDEYAVKVRAIGPPYSYSVGGDSAAKSNICSMPIHHTQVAQARPRSDGYNCSASVVVLPTPNGSQSDLV